MTNPKTASHGAQAPLETIGQDLEAFKDVHISLAPQTLVTSGRVVEISLFINLESQLEEIIIVI